MPIIHATCVAIESRGVLLRGASGSGKSSIALRLIDEGARLVADDQVMLTAANAQTLVASAPVALRGLLELRGYGIVRLPYAESSALALLVDLMPFSLIDRLPDPTLMVQGVPLPYLQLSAQDAGAPAKIRAALRYDRLAPDAFLSLSDSPKKDRA